MNTIADGWAQYLERFGVPFGPELRRLLEATYYHGAGDVAHALAAMHDAGPQLPPDYLRQVQQFVNEATQCLLADVGNSEG